jgi:hypothetical protein
MGDGKVTAHSPDLLAAAAEAIRKSRMVPYSDGKGGHLFREATADELAAVVVPLIEAQAGARVAEECPDWCAFTGSHTHGTPSVIPPTTDEPTDWQAVAERTLHGAGNWKRRFEAERAENDQWRDALALTTAQREWLDNAVPESRPEIMRRILAERAESDLTAARETLARLRAAISAEITPSLDTAEWACDPLPSCPQYAHVNPDWLRTLISEARNVRAALAADTGHEQEVVTRSWQDFAREAGWAPTDTGHDASGRAREEALREVIESVMGPSDDLRDAGTCRSIANDIEDMIRADRTGGSREGSGDGA